jgi:hypothetical protein
MLRLTLTAYTPEETTIGYLDICNTGTGLPGYGNYACALLDAALHARRHAEVTHYPSYLGAWGLVQRALTALEPLAHTVPGTEVPNA